MRIYFLGIVGTAMGNAALLLRDMGHEVLGSDQAIYPPMSDLLKEAGIEALEGYDADRLASLAPDLVVVGNAFSRGNVEVEYLLRSGAIEFCSMPELLARYALKGRDTIVVAGTHGKTTTTALTAHLLQEAELEPGYLIGGAPLDPPSGWSNGGKGSPFVIEGDEYDSAFFDKRSKFIHYRPRILILNNLEFDHADIFRDLEDVKRSFSHLLRIVPENGYVLANGDDPNVQSLLPVSWTQVINVGIGENCDLRIENYETTQSGSRFDLAWRGELWKSVGWGMVGLFNARNAAMASLAAALAASPDAPRCFDLKGLESFRGVKRRQQNRFRSPTLSVIEDFAHHPTAIKETLHALRAQNPDTRILAAFEPRSNTSRLESMREPMRDALSEADEILIGPAKIAGPQGFELLDTSALAEELRAGGVSAEAFAENSALLSGIKERLAERGDRKALVVFLTNGSFGGIIDDLQAYLESGQ